VNPGNHGGGNQGGGNHGGGNQGGGNQGGGGSVPTPPPANTGQQVPVPAAVWLFGSGLVGLMGLRRKSKLAV
ncbi:MAG: VPLPA-CTERM sorting domain-containing protein, partial [Methyloglobulus sp.]|nr:VPLPA-CTERM sorting domain-containing protein [Methyloglobulus sp.]